MIKLKIIDAEVHLLHPEACSRNFSKYTDEPSVKAIHLHPDFHLVENILDLNSLKQSMLSSGISQSIIMGMSWRDSGIQNANNDYIAECVLKNPDLFKALYIPNLNNIKSAILEVENLRSDIFLGVKLLTRDQGRKILDPEMFPLYELLIERKLPLMLHIDHLTQTMDGDLPSQLFNLINKFPKLKIVAAHLGGLLCLYGLMPKLRETISKITFITSVSATIKMVEFAAEVNENNLIFGSDFPFNHCHSQKQLIDDINKLNLTDTCKDKIYNRNARDLYGLK